MAQRLGKETKVKIIEEKLALYDHIARLEDWLVFRCSRSVLPGVCYQRVAAAEVALADISSAVQSGCGCHGGGSHLLGQSV
ncbi:hypothetical protein DPEC_G00301490 [Dallia pectoralis]|uniref:Uncharacterized protein n=1 Tax=Dallia pectoralis TaxID=75939 RepID=A0ACC2FGI0_DALPE|nr:hypothetical protein DPEC_G00301490 [Dallia pectoralis]